MSFFIHNVTIYHENNDTFTRMQFKEVYFRHNKKTNVIDKGLEKGSTGTIVIPTTKKLNISDNDYVVDGLVNDDFDFKKLISKYQLFRIVSVDDNRKGSLQHYKLGVSE